MGRAETETRELLQDLRGFMAPRVIEPEIESLREGAERAVSGAQAQAVVEIKPGSPREELIALSREVDLLVIGSRRWGAAARVLRGTTGEELMHQACCPVMVVPRSHAGRRDAGRGWTFS